MNIQFHYLMDLHYSQTANVAARSSSPFHYLMDLHYSQTMCANNPQCHCFTTLWIYTILKQGQTLLLLDICFTTLWIYTILKLRI